VPRNSDELPAKVNVLFGVIVIAVGFLAILLIHSSKASANENHDRLALSEPIVLGELDKDTDLRPVIEDNNEYIRDCFKPAEESGDLLPCGRVVIKFVVNRDGQVSSAKVNSTSLREPVVEACLCSVFEQMTFPRSHIGGITIVTQDIAYGQRPIQERPDLPDIRPSLNGPPQGSGNRYEFLPREADTQIEILDQEVEDAKQAVNDAQIFFNNMAMLSHEDPHKGSLLTIAFTDLEEAQEIHKEAVLARDRYLRGVGRP
jgi:hypothetical protein